MILIGTQRNALLEKSAHYVAINDAIERLAASESVPIVSRYTIMRASALATGYQAILSADAFYLNDLGYRCVAQSVADLITSTIVADPQVR